MNDDGTTRLGRDAEESAPGSASEHPPMHRMPGPGPSGLTRGIVWGHLAAAMRAEAAAAGDDRFEKLDALVTPRRRTPYEARPIDLGRVRAERADHEDGERAA